MFSVSVHYQWGKGTSPPNNNGGIGKGGNGSQTYSGLENQRRFWEGHTLEHVGLSHYLICCSWYCISVKEHCILVKELWLKYNVNYNWLQCVHCVEMSNTNLRGKQWTNLILKLPKVFTNFN